MLGLSSRELLVNFIKFLQWNAAQTDAELAAIEKGGGDPVAKKFLDELRCRTPNIDTRLLMYIFCIFQGLMETIASNNEALDRVLGWAAIEEKDHKNSR